MDKSKQCSDSAQTGPGTNTPPLTAREHKPASLGAATTIPPKGVSNGGK